MTIPLFRFGRCRKAVRIHLHDLPRDLSPHLMRDVGLDPRPQALRVDPIPRW